MTAQAAVELQRQIVLALVQSIPEVPISTGPTLGYPVDGRFIRVDGFNMVNDDLYKNNESASHRFFVHIFDAPAGGTRSLLWTRETQARIHLALDGKRLAGGLLKLESMQVDFDPKAAEGVFDAHGISRYRVQIGA